MVVAFTARATFRSAFRPTRRAPSGRSVGSTLCGPAGSQTVSSSATGHNWPSTMAGPFQGRPTPDAESTMVFGPIFSMRVTVAEAEGSNFKSGGSREISKYSATRWKLAAAWCRSWKSSVPVCCLVG